MAGTDIYTGFWIDHSQGTVLGSVLTYKASYGNQLITAAALVITLTGSAFWSIIGFVIHQQICREPNQDEFDAQLRVVMKNGGPPDAVSTLLDMGCTWHGRAKGAWKRTILFMIPPLFIFLSFTIAGVVVSFIALDPNHSPALVKKGNCGIVSQSTKAVGLQSASNTTIVAAAYVRDCYSRDNTGAVACNTFNKPTLPYSKGLNGSCPLGERRCSNGDRNAANLTTILDSHDDLGINAKKSDRIQVGYSAFYNIHSDNGSFSYSSVNLAWNYSAWSYSNITSWGTLNVGVYQLFPYKTYWPHNNTGETGYAKPPFNQSNKDITIALINTNGMTYLGESKDPIFATDPNRIRVIPTYATLYAVKQQVSAIVCSDAWQFCNGADRCSGWRPLLSFDQNFVGPHSTQALSSLLGMNAAQNATLFRIAFGGLDAASIYLSMFTPTPLRASDAQLGGLIASNALPDDQWVTEVETWYQISLAKMQYLAKLFANIPPSLALGAGSLIYPPDAGLMTDQCSQQRIQIPAGYQNFSVFGLCFVFAMGFVTLLAAWLLKKYHHKLPGRAEGQLKHDKLLSYQADGYVQLHRAAMELAGHAGKWYGAHDGKTDVPYTKKAERVLTRHSLTYRSGAGLGKGNSDQSKGSADAKVISGSWNGTGIAGV